MSLQVFFKLYKLKGKVKKIKNKSQGVWVAQPVKCLTLGFSSDHDLRVARLSPTSDSVWNPLERSPSAPSSLSLK